MQQHEHHAKLEAHEPRNEEEEEDKNNKDIHVITREQVCNGVANFYKNILLNGLKKLEK